jgi:transketolase
VRSPFVGELVRRAAEDDRIFLVVGDLGYSVVEPFRDRFPGRFLNAGVAEQNMAGVAAGLAREGYRVFAYSIANFPTLRCLEQIRNDICFHGLDVTIAAVGGGFMYGSLGASHHATEDVGILRALPGMRVYAPGFAAQIPGMVGEILAERGPAYLRLGRAGGPGPDGFAPCGGGWMARREGGRSARVAIGNVLAAAAKALPLAEGERCDLWVAGRLKPMPGDVLDALAEYEAIDVVEDHQRSCGLFSALAERLYDRAVRQGRPLLRSHAVPDRFSRVAGSEMSLQSAMIFPGAESSPAPRPGKS